MAAGGRHRAHPYHRRRMEPTSARRRLTLLAAALIAAGAALGLYAANASGAFDPIAAMLPKVVAGTPVSRGEHIYSASCASCHGGRAGGAISDYPPKHNANGHTWQHGDCEIDAAIRTGTGLRHRVETRPASPPAALAMPAWGERLSDDQISDVIAYNKTLWTAGQRASQDALTRELCAAT
jgi:mono/diheme cytochrome c family protein